MNSKREKALRRLSDADGWIRTTQREAADRIGVSKRTYIRWIDEAKSAGLIVETSANGRHFRLSKKGQQNQTLTDNVDNVANVDIPEKCEQSREVTDNVDILGSQNVANVDKNASDSAVLSFPFSKLKEKNYINPRAREAGGFQAGLRSTHSAAAASIVDYFFSVFPMRGFMAPTGISNVLTRAEGKYGAEVVQEAIDEIAMANGTRRTPNAAQLYGFCERIQTRQNQNKETRPYSNPIPVTPELSEADRKAALRIFEEAIKGFE